ncbi:MAG: MBL fold metallo-hydrolase [Candidatus Aureabacteria bacterium]|nr:MBL fold metallo-hydrolase [Candidatus Auribacterota bacterium]
MKLCVLGSGSEGNSILFQTRKACILIDSGFSAAEMEKRLSLAGYRPADIDAIFISHEHIDHIRSVKMLHEKYNISLFANRPTANEVRKIFKNNLKFHIFLTNRPFVFKDIVVEPFSVFHDAMEPVGFSIAYKNIKFSVATDLGFPSSGVKEKMKNSHFVVLESNHDEQMLLKSRRPHGLKKRILSRLGHLSNSSAGNLLQDICHQDLHKVILAHLSRECNSPQLAMETIRNIFTQNQNLSPDIEAACQDTVSEIYTL